MDRATKTKIESFAWDITIGNGRAEEINEGPGEPQTDDLEALDRLLGRKATGEEQGVFIDAFHRCLQEAAQP